MKKGGWRLGIGAGLLVLSVILYGIHFLLFRDAHHIFIYGLGELAFIPIEVLLVTLIIHELLEVRERKARLEKLNMIIGVFFSETGTKLLNLFSSADPGLDRIKSDLIVKEHWSDVEFDELSTRLKSYDYDIQISELDLTELNSFLVGQRGFLLELLENPSLLEHESFTELMRAVFHLLEELANRTDLSDLPITDMEHLGGDIKRVYGLLVQQWVDYMRYLKDNYPYLFSLAMRMNPFDSEVSVIVA